MQREPRFTLSTPGKVRDTTGRRLTRRRELTLPFKQIDLKRRYKRAAVTAAFTSNLRARRINLKSSRILPFFSPSPRDPDVRSLLYLSLSLSFFFFFAN